MKISPVVKQETIKIAAGVLVLTVLMIAVFLIIGKFDYTVLLGALLGSAAAIGNFFLMAMAVAKQADSMPPLPPQPEEENDDAGDADRQPAPLSPEARRAGKRMQLSFALRMLLLGGIAILAVSLPIFHSYAALIPMLFPRIVIFLIGILPKKQKEV